MPKCPMCSKKLEGYVRRCPSCKAELDLLVDYVSYLQGGLVRADGLTRSGELGQAVWAYLEILEVDPENPEARRQVGSVATAVRQFDHRNATGWPKDERADRFGTGLWKGVAIVALLLLAMTVSFGAGYGVGSAIPPSIAKDKVPAEEKRNTMTGE